jgi:hypothetical protein
MRKIARICLSAMTYRSLFSNGMIMSGEPRKPGSGKAPVTAGAGFQFAPSSRQRFWLFRMPPSATVEADILKNGGPCYEVNTRLCPKAALAFLATFKAVGMFFLSHKG